MKRRRVISGFVENIIAVGDNLSVLTLDPLDQPARDVHVLIYMVADDRFVFRPVDIIEWRIGFFGRAYRQKIESTHEIRQSTGVVPYSSIEKAYRRYLGRVDRKEVLEIF